MASEDHPLVKTMRYGLDISDDANFLEAVATKFVCVDPASRKKDLAQMREALQEPAGLREKTQLATVARRLSDVDAKMRRTGR